MSLRHGRSIAQQDNVFEEVGRVEANLARALTRKNQFRRRRLRESLEPLLGFMRKDVDERKRSHRPVTLARFHEERRRRAEEESPSGDLGVGPAQSQSPTSGAGGHGLRDHDMRTTLPGHPYLRLANDGVARICQPQEWTDQADASAGGCAVLAQADLVAPGRCVFAPGPTFAWKPMLRARRRCAAPTFAHIKAPSACVGASPGDPRSGLLAALGDQPDPWEFPELSRR